jgi:hypothetical protein
MLTEHEPEPTDFEDEDTLEYLFVDDYDEDELEDDTWEWDGTAWQRVP